MGGGVDFRDRTLEWLPANPEGRGGFPGAQRPGDPRQHGERISAGQGSGDPRPHGVGLEQDRPGSRGLTRGSDWLAGRARAGQNRRNLSVAASCGRYQGRRGARPARSGICSRPKPHHKLAQSRGSLRRENSSNHMAHGIADAMSFHSRIRQCWNVAWIDAISRQTARAHGRAARFQDDRKIRPVHTPGEGPRTSNAAPPRFPV